MPTNLFSVLESRMDEFTPAERQIANFILNNKNGIPFETATSLAEKLGVSAVTVGRFCRNLGYKHFRAVKEDLRNSVSAAPWLVGEQLNQFVKRFDDQQQLRKSLEMEIANIVEVYHMVDTPQWKAAVNTVVKSTTVNVAAFQTERGLGALLANALQYVRGGVQLVDLTAGHFGDALAAPPAKTCVILIEIKRYSRHAYLLAKECAARKIPLIIITDKYCDWARRFTPNVFAVPTKSGQVWDSVVPMTCLMNLFLNAVVARSGPSVENHLQEISDLFEHFSGWVGAGGRRGVEK
jgi:DNA-binding MurR/RpiR family transcriptional regulator